MRSLWLHLLTSQQRLGGYLNSTHNLSIDEVGYARHGVCGRIILATDVRNLKIIVHQKLLPPSLPPEEVFLLGKVLQGTMICQHLEGHANKIDMPLLQCADDYEEFLFVDRVIKLYTFQLV